MRTKWPKDSGVPGAHSAWNEIVPRLFVGGHFYVNPAGTRAAVVVGNEFDLVISLYSRAGHGPRTRQSSSVSPGSTPPPSRFQYLSPSD